MKIDHVRFFVANGCQSRDWFVRKLGFRWVSQQEWQQSQVDVVNSGDIYFALCSPKTESSPIAQWLQQQPSGVADVVLRVDDIKAAIARTQPYAALLQPIQSETYPQGLLRWAAIAAWGNLTHTFVERTGITPLLPQGEAISQEHNRDGWIGRRNAVVHQDWFSRIDHIVLNVPQGELEPAIAWYENVLGLQSAQSFQIQTDYSGLCSRVMRHPNGFVQIPINEPTSPNSQIQEFLDLNRGAGIQHIALETSDLLGAIAHLRAQGLPLIQVPPSYYSNLQHPTVTNPESLLSALQQQQILAEWQPQHNALLLQTFTQPVFEQPTLFFELIQRQLKTPLPSLERAQGFGAGNFRALFEAIEREQIKRGTLKAIP